MMTAKKEDAELQARMAKMKGEMEDTVADIKKNWGLPIYLHIKWNGIFTYL